MVIKMMIVLHMKLCSNFARVVTSTWVLILISYSRKQYNISNNVTKIQFWHYNC